MAGLVGSRILVIPFVILPISMDLLVGAMTAIHRPPEQRASLSLWMPSVHSGIDLSVDFPLVVSAIGS